MPCPLTDCKYISIWGKIPPKAFTNPNSKKSPTQYEIISRGDSDFYFCQSRGDILTLVCVWGGSADTELYLVKDAWARLGRQEPQGKKCKVGGKSLALFACSLSITCLPSLAGKWKKKMIRRLDNNLSLCFCIPDACGFKKHPRL